MIPYPEKYTHVEIQVHKDELRILLINEIDSVNLFQWLWHKQEQRVRRKNYHKLESDMWRTLTISRIADEGVLVPFIWDKNVYTFDGEL